MPKAQKPVAPAKKPSNAAKPEKPASKKPKPPADDDLYEQGDMATPERDPPYEDGL